MDIASTLANPVTPARRSSGPSNSLTGRVTDVSEHQTWGPLREFDKLGKANEMTGNVQKGRPDLPEVRNTTPEVPLSPRGGARENAG